MSAIQEILEGARDVLSSIFYNVSWLITEERKRIEGKVLGFFKEITKDSEKIEK